MSIYQKLQNAKDHVVTISFKKEGKSGKFDYFNPSQVEKITQEACKVAGIIATCNLLVDEFGYYQELTLTDLDDIKQQLTFTMRTKFGKIINTNDTQSMGGTDTYSERYIKMKVFGIKDDNIDPDKTSGQKAVVKPTKKKLNKVQFDKFLLQPDEYINKHKGSVDFTADQIKALTERLEIEL